MKPNLSKACDRSFGSAVQSITIVTSVGTTKAFASALSGDETSFLVTLGSAEPLDPSEQTSHIFSVHMLREFAVRGACLLLTIKATR